MTRRPRILGGLRRLSGRCGPPARAAKKAPRADDCGKSLAPQTLSVSFASPLSLAMLREVNEEGRSQETEKSGKRDFPAAVRPLAVDLARASVDQNLIGPVAIAVGQHPDRQQDVLERDLPILRTDAVHLLFVAADSLPHVLLEGRVDFAPRQAEAVPQLDVVRPRHKTREHFLGKRTALLQGPWRQSVQEVAANSARRGDQHIVEKTLELSGDRPPACAADLLLLIAVAYGFPVILASLAIVGAGGHGVVRPEGQVDAVEFAVRTAFTKFIRCEPARANPPAEVAGRLLASDGEGQQAVDGDPPASRVHVLALHLAAAVGALGTCQCAHKDNVGAAALTTDVVLGSFLFLLRAPRGRLFLQLRDRRLEILLGDFRVRRDDDVLFKTAVRTLQPLVADVKDQLGSAPLTGKHAAPPGIDRVALGR